MVAKYPHILAIKQGETATKDNSGNYSVSGGSFVDISPCRFEQVGGGKAYVVDGVEYQIAGKVYLKSGISGIETGSLARISKNTDVIFEGQIINVIRNQSNTVLWV